MAHAHMSQYNLPQGPPRPWNEPGVPWPPQNEWLPIYAQRTPYNEDEIVRLIEEIYKIYITFGYIAASKVDWAPSSGHPINETLCAELGMAPSVISLIKRLPYVRGRTHGVDDMDFNLFPSSPQFNYLSETWMRLSRKQEIVSTVELESQDVCLTDANGNGTSIILDTKTNLIRLSGQTQLNEESSLLEKPDEPDHYRNLRGHHALSFLQNHIERMRSLDLIPMTSRGYHYLRDDQDHADARYHERLHPIMKRILIEDYGYPDHFRQSEWMENKDEIWETKMTELWEEYEDY